MFQVAKAGMSHLLGKSDLYWSIWIWRQAALWTFQLTDSGHISFDYFQVTDADKDLSEVTKTIEELAPVIN